MLSAVKLCQSVSISGPVATAKPRSAKISASSSITCDTGCTEPFGASGAGSVWFVSELTDVRASVIRLPLSTAASLSGSVTPSAPPGGTITATVQAAANGPDDLGAPVVTLAADPNETILAVTGPAGWTCPAPTGQPGGAVVCRGARLAAGETAAFTATMFVSSTATAGSVLTAKATLEGSTPLAAPVPVVDLPTTVTGATTPTAPSTPLVPAFTG